MLFMASPAMAEPINIGVMLSRLEHLFLTRVHEATKEQANAMGDINLRFENAQGDVNRQNNQVQNFL
jgi:inositol transport system substrate-binding protein